MGYPAAPLPGQRRYEVPINEARMRLQQLARLSQTADQVTYIVDGGTAVAAIVPVPAARSASQARAAAAHSEAAAVGWMQRIDRLREDLRRQHTVENAVLARALEEVWELLDQRCPPGSDRAVDTARAAHREHRRHTR